MPHPDRRSIPKFQKKDGKNVTRLLEENLKVKGAGELLETALIKGDTRMVEQLLTANPDLISQVDKYLRTALHCIVLTGDERMVAQVLPFIAPDLVDCVDYHKMTALHYAAKRGCDKIVAQLLVKAKKLNLPDRFSKLPLHYAAEEGHEKVVALLLAKNPNLATMIDGRGRNALHLAVISGHEAVADVLLALKPELVFVKDRQNNTVLHHAVTCTVVRVAFIERLYELNKEALQVVNASRRTPFQNAQFNKPIRDFLQWKLCVDDVMPLFGAGEHIGFTFKSLVEGECEVLQTYLNRDVIGTIHAYVFDSLESLKRPHSSSTVQRKDFVSLTSKYRKRPVLSDSSSSGSDD